MFIVYAFGGKFAAMTAKFQQNSIKRRAVVGFAGLLLVSGCMGSGTSFLQDTGLTEPLPAPSAPNSPAVSSADQLEETPGNTPSSTTDQLYSNLPTGPANTGTYPDFRDEPEVRIVSKPGQDVERLTNQMIALANDHESGRISTEVYKKRLAYLRALAKNHSSDMLAQIGEPAN